MTVRQPRYSKEEFARRGDEIYEFQVRLQVEAGNHGKIVATTSRPRTLKLMQVKSLLVIALKHVTQMLRSRLSVLVPVMCVDSVEERSDRHDYWNRQCGV